MCLADRAAREGAVSGGTGKPVTRRQASHWLVQALALLMYVFRLARWPQLASSS